jgi:hypothetical protein
MSFVVRRRGKNKPREQDGKSFFSKTYATRTASASHKPKAITQTTSPEVRSHPFKKMTNAVQRLKFGLQTVGNKPSRKHEKEGWMRGKLIKAGMWDGDKKT